MSKTIDAWCDETRKQIQFEIAAKYMGAFCRALNSIDEEIRCCKMIQKARPAVCSTEQQTIDTLELAKRILVAEIMEVNPDFKENEDVV